MVRGDAWTVVRRLPVPGMAGVLQAPVAWCRQPLAHHPLAHLPLAHLPLAHRPLARHQGRSRAARAGFRHRLPEAPPGTRAPLCPVRIAARGPKRVDSRGRVVRRAGRVPTVHAGLRGHRRIGSRPRGRRLARDLGGRIDPPAPAVRGGTNDRTCPTAGLMVRGGAGVSMNPGVDRVPARRRRGPARLGAAPAAGPAQDSWRVLVARLTGALRTGSKRPVGRRGLRTGRTSRPMPATSARALRKQAGTALHKIRTGGGPRGLRAGTPPVRSGRRTARAWVVAGTGAPAG